VASLSIVRMESTKLVETKTINQSAFQLQIACQVNQSFRMPLQHLIAFVEIAPTVSQSSRMPLSVKTGTPYAILTSSMSQSQLHQLKTENAQVSLFVKFTNISLRLQPMMKMHNVQTLQIVSQEHMYSRSRTQPVIDNVRHASIVIRINKILSNVHHGPIVETKRMTVPDYQESLVQHQAIVMYAILIHGLRKT
jgi:hypothetical protein